MPRRTFVIQSDSKTRCAVCNGTVDLLALENPIQNGPMFYICWTCKRVAQVGLGPVKREGKRDYVV